MPQLTIEFAVPGFACRFVWEAEEAEVSETITAVDEAARHAGFAPQNYRLNCVVHAPSLLSDDNNTLREMAMAAIVAFVLCSPTGHPDHPGLISDYVGVAHFEVIFNSIAGGRIDCEVHASPTADLGGFA